MSGSSFVLLYEKRGAIALVTLNRPAARNAITPEMACRMADAFADASADDAVRVVILTGAGDKAFCSGGDLGRMLPLMTGAREPEDEWDRRVLDDPAVMARSSLRGYAFDKPVVAAINGACLAGGMETVLATDIRIAAEHATFGLPEVKRALIPFAGSLVRLPRQVAYCHAMELLLTGDAIRRGRGAADGAGEPGRPGAGGHAASPGGRTQDRSQRPGRHKAGEAHRAGQQRPELGGRVPHGGRGQPARHGDQ